MSLLYPLFLAGIAAAAAPILLHMIRRHTRQRVTFSSLMFLRPTMPRFRSRSRLEHVLLLIVRCSVLCLLAFAFARPFLARPAATGAADSSKRIVLLIDTSASMRRSGLWTRALDEAQSVLKETGPADRVCVMSFDQGTRTLIGFDQWQTMAPAQRAAIASQEISKLSPGWSSTDLGHALVTAADALEDDEANDGAQSRAQCRIVLIGDLQQGSKLDALLAYEWPQRTELVVKAIPCRGVTNASLQLLANRDSLGPARSDDSPDIRITNSPDATNDHFQLHWADSAQPGAAVDVYVAAGHSTVVHAPAEPNQQTSARLVLTGDDQDFDNTLYVMPQLRRQVNILYLGRDDPNDTAGMLYYLRQAFGTGKALTSRIVRHPGSEVLDAADIVTAHLIVVTDNVNQQNITALRRYLESGKPLLFAMRSAEAADALSGLAGVDTIDAQEAEVSRYAMLGRLEFDHPLLKPFSDPRFGDFTRIHFWKHRRVDTASCPGARVLARFDNGDPAWFEVPVGRGTLLVWTSGWQPSDSDLALSSKFVPLLYGTLEYGGTLTEHPSQYFVGDAVPITGRIPAGTTDIQVRKPDGVTVRMDGNQQTFTQTDLPGIYSISDSTRDTDPQFFAVNLPAAESRTDPMPVEDLEKRDVPLTPTAAVVSEVAQRAARHNSFTEMESQQKLWRWVLVATLILLLIETWLGGWLGTPQRETERLGTPLTRPGPAPEREPI
ncbi:MAG: BatA and WFA domain-containing protein [Phycisphaerae bacterium]|nr:BatA and WFA domain-containing protein [Phycisphaerae bacterium]